MRKEWQRASGPPRNPKRPAGRNGTPPKKQR
jgi:hypothetical protein